MTDKPAPIDQLFKRLATTYGAAWERSIGQSPIADVKTTWAHELAGFLQNRATMQAIAWALDNLPEKCPNVIEFKHLCRRAPAPETPRLPEPKADAQRVAAELAKLAPMAQQIGQQVERKDCKSWASESLANPRLSTVTGVQMARNALNAD
jgi:hypothetical protein